MKRTLATLALLACLAALLALSLLATADVSAAPNAVASPSPRPSLTPRPVPTGDPEDCYRVYDDLAYLVIFRCGDGALVFYPMDNQQGRFHTWLGFTAWAYAAPGQLIFARADDSLYHISLWRLTDSQIQAQKLDLRTPPDKKGNWFRVVLKNPVGATTVDNVFFVDF
jgi:hypothetical protein